jgi:hypothetical protein
VGRLWSAPSDGRRAKRVGGERGGRVRRGGAGGRRLGKRGGRSWARGLGGWSSWVAGGGPHLALHGVASGPVPTGQVGVVRAGGWRWCPSGGQGARPQARLRRPEWILIGDAAQSSWSSKPEFVVMAGGRPAPGPGLATSSWSRPPGRPATCQAPCDRGRFVGRSGPERGLVVPGVVLGIFPGGGRHEWDGVAFTGWNCSIWVNGVEWYR